MVEDDAAVLRGCAVLRIDDTHDAEQLIAPHRGGWAIQGLCACVEEADITAQAPGEPGSGYGAASGGDPLRNWIPWICLCVGLRNWVLNSERLILTDSEAY